MRHLALLVLPKEKEFVSCLHPQHYPVEGENHCAYYRSNVKVCYARGFRRVLENFPMKMLEAFRDELLTVFGHNRYYQLRRGTQPISPKEQEKICKIACEKGFKDPFTFDVYEEGYLW